MTREEAIERIKDHMVAHKMDEPRAIYISEALEMAIAALKAEPCEEAVSRADTLQSFESYCEKNCQFSKKQRDVMCGACMMGDAIEIVESLPPVTPKQRTGKIIMGGYDCDHYVCSECGHDFGWYSKPNHKYCPNCGAKMEGE